MADRPPVWLLPLFLAAILLAASALSQNQRATSRGQVHFNHSSLPFTLHNGESPRRYVPETMAGGVAVFDYDNDGDLDIYFANGAEMPRLEKTGPEYWNRLFANDGKGHFTDVTEKAGVAGQGYATGVSVADYDNDGYKDVFVAGVHRYTLYRNRGDGTFLDVTASAGLDAADPDYSLLWAVGAIWLDYDQDGDLDLFVVNYLQWDPATEPRCADYCHPREYGATPNRLYRNNGDGTFTDVSDEAGIRKHAGKGMGGAAADFDRDGDLDIFVTNDKTFNFFFRNEADGTFTEMAFEAGVALPEHAMFVSGMGADFRDLDNDGFPDIVFVALEQETFPVFRNTGKSLFEDVTLKSGVLLVSRLLSGYSPAVLDFDRDGWKDIFVSCGHVQSTKAIEGVMNVVLPNAVFRGLGKGRFELLVEEAGLAAAPPKRHRGAAFGDFNDDGRIDAVVTALMAEAEVWINDSPADNHWLALELEGTRSNRDGIGAEVKVVAGGLTQYNHVTTSYGYASSSAGPLFFGLGDHASADQVVIWWPSGTIQTLKAIAADELLKVHEPLGSQEPPIAD